MRTAARRAHAQAIRGRRAGLAIRLLANGVDLLIIIAIFFGLLVTIAATQYMLGSGEFELPQGGLLKTAIMLPIIEVLYLGIAWGASGRTIGKDLFGLRVVRNDGQRLGRWHAGGRAVVCTILGIPSLLWCAFSKRNAGVHDLLLKTAVAHDWPDAPERGGSQPLEIHIKNDNTTVVEAPGAGETVTRGG